MLEESDSIDMMVTSQDGKLLLVITDAGLTTDEDQRLALLASKLRTYVSYVWGKQFAVDHPQKKPSEVVIQVMCAMPPTPRMQSLTAVTPSGDPSRAVAVRFQHFPPP